MKTHGGVNEFVSPGGRMGERDSLLVSENSSMNEVVRSTTVVDTDDGPRREYEVCTCDMTSQ